VSATRPPYALHALFVVFRAAVWGLVGHFPNYFSHSRNSHKPHKLMHVSGKHDAFAGVNAATIASKMTIAAVN